jgi:hypothetical protein
MRSLLNDLAILNHIDTVNFPDGGQAVSNDDGRPAFHQAVQGFLDDALALGVEAAGGFVEQQHRGVFQNSPGNGYPLPLPATKLNATVTNYRIETLGELLDKF